MTVSDSVKLKEEKSSVLSSSDGEDEAQGKEGSTVGIV